MKILLLALGSMFLQQTFIALGRTLPAIIAPAIISDLIIDPVWIGIYFSVTALSSLVVQLGCGSFIVRYGAMRISQMSLFTLAFSLVLAAMGTPLMLILSAILGGGSAVSTPASSHILSRCTPQLYFPLVFSMKQTAVPTGLLLAGLIGPQLTEQIGWQNTLLICASACAVFGLILEPLRHLFDDDRVKTRFFQLSDFKTTFVSVLGTSDLRNMSMACLIFNGMQSVVTAYFVIFLTTIGYTPVAAGLVFSMAVLVAIPGRILWGWLSSSLVSPRLMLAGLGIGMALSGGALGFCGVGWPTIVVSLIACLLSATALSWHGILLAETARVAPTGMLGGVTGGVLAVGQVGALMFPLMFSGLLEFTGSYGLGFIACALPSLLVGFQMIRPIESFKEKR